MVLFFHQNVNNMQKNDTSLIGLFKFVRWFYTMLDSI